MAGCTAGSDISARAFGDEVAIGTEAYGLDYGSPAEMLPVMMRLVLRGRGPLSALRALGRSLNNLPKTVEVGRAHCEVATHLAERFGFDEPFRAALFQAFERWDGSGKPLKPRGEAIALGMRIAQVAIDANIGHRLGGVDGAVALVRKRAKRGLDPELVERFAAAAADVCAPLGDPSPWAAALAAEPEPHRTVEGEAIDHGLRAIAHFSDIKSRFTHSHSTGVSTLASTAAQRLGLGAEAELTLARAGLVHDVGRVAVTAAVWEKTEPLTDTEREQIRLHTYVGERVLARAASLASAVEVATLAPRQRGGRARRGRACRARTGAPERAHQSRGRA